MAQAIVLIDWPENRGEGGNSYKIPKYGTCRSVLENHFLKSQLLISIPLAVMEYFLVLSQSHLSSSLLITLSEL